MPRTNEANQRLREAQRAKILEAARRVFARSGVAATMAEVAAEAHVSQGLAYRYFDNKEAIIRALVEQSLQPMLATMQHLEELPGTPGVHLRFLISTLWENRRDDPEFFQLLYEVLNDEAAPEDLRELIDRQSHVFRDVLRQLIVAGQASGEVAAGNPEQLVTLVMICLHGLSSLAMHDPERWRLHFPDVALFLRILAPHEELHLERRDEPL